MEKQIQELEHALTKGPEFALEVFDRLLSTTSLRRSDISLYQANFNITKSEFLKSLIDHDTFAKMQAKVSAGLRDLLPLMSPQDFKVLPSDLEREGLFRQLDLCVRKLQKMKEAIILETDPSRLFAYEQQVDHLEKQIAEIKSQL